MTTTTTAALKTFRRELRNLGVDVRFDGNKSLQDDLSLLAESVLKLNSWSHCADNGDKLQPLIDAAVENMEDDNYIDQPRRKPLLYDRTWEAATFVAFERQLVFEAAFQRENALVDLATHRPQALGQVRPFVRRILIESQSDGLNPRWVTPHLWQFAKCGIEPSVEISDAFLLVSVRQMNLERKALSDVRLSVFRAARRLYEEAAKLDEATSHS